MRCNPFSLMILAAGLAITTSAVGQAAAPEKGWVERSNHYTQTLLDVQLKYSPEGGSRQGLAKYDALITDPTWAAEIAQRKELEGVLATLKKAEAKETSQDVREDLEILQKTFNLHFRQQDYWLEHTVPSSTRVRRCLEACRRCSTIRYPRSAAQRL
jgi:hypothetical protein